MPSHPVIDAAQAARGRVLSAERQTATRLVDAYGRAYQRMGNQIAALEETLRTSGELTAAKAANLSTLRNLRGQIVEELDRFAVYADQEITRAAYANISAAIADSRTLVQAYLISPEGQRAIEASFRILPTESVLQMLGFLAEDAPLHTSLVGTLGEAVASRFEQALIDGIVMGRGPAVTAGIIRNEIGQGLTWALNTARTAQIYSYREATRASYMANSDIVKGWQWHASLDDRVCMSCVSKHGSRHKVDERLNDHHSGRCVALPIIELPGGAGDLPTQTGEQWFGDLAETQQTQMMGGAMYRAWRAGEFGFSELSTPYDDPIYGTMLREASLKGILGDRAREYYQ